MPAPSLHLRQVQLVAISDGELHLELARRLVQQQDPERPIVDQPAHEDGDPLEQLVEIQDRRYLLANLRQRLERRRILALAIEQPRVLERHRHVRAELPQDRFVSFGELARLRAEEVQGADDALLPPQRHHQLGPCARHRVDVTRIAGHVADAHRFSPRDRGADDALANLHPERAAGLLRVSDRVGDAQVAAFVVQQIHGEGVKLGEPGDELRDLLEQLVEVQHRRHFPPQLEQREQQRRIARGAVPSGVGWL